MILDRVEAGTALPEEFNVIIEIPTNAEPVKYEVDKETGALFVDRFMMTASRYRAAEIKPRYRDAGAGSVLPGREESSRS